MRQFKAEDWFGCLDGQDIVVMGLGPSLKEVLFEQPGLRACWTIGVNDISRFGLSPDFLVVIDPKSRLDLMKRWEWIKNTQARIVFYYAKLPLVHPVQAAIDLRIATMAGEGPVCGMDSKTGIPAWKHSPHPAAALAIRMGAVRVFFIGVDVNDVRHPSGRLSEQIVSGTKRLMGEAKKAGCEFHTLTKESALADIMPFAEVGDVRPKYLPTNEESNANSTVSQQGG